MDAEFPSESQVAPNYYVHKDGVTYGPDALANLGALWEQGWLLPEDVIWKEGEPEWVSAGAIFAAGLTATGKPALVEAPSHEGEAHEEDFLHAGAIPLSPERPWPWSSLAIALVANVALFFLVLQWLHLYPIKLAPYTSPPTQEPPLEVAMVPEADPVPPPPPPPDPTPTSPAPTPPPSPASLPLPDLPPPPPMSAIMPVPSLPPPPIPDESVIPPETTATPTPPKPAPQHHKIVKAVIPPPIPATPEEPPPSDTSEPEYLSNPRPIYPFAARQRHLQGTVLLLVTLDEAGNPTSVSVEQSSGYKMLDQAAQKKVAADWRFKPGQSSTVHVPVEFHLEDSSN